MSTGVRYAMCAVAALLQSGVAQAATQQPEPVNGRDDELDEVVVTGAQEVRSPKAILAWLRRLIGQYSYEGYVELGGEGAPKGRRAANGTGKCIPFDEAVQCAIHVRWPDIKAEDGRPLPGGVSTLSPAVILYGVDWKVVGIRSMLVDNLGMAHGGLGELRGGTLITATACVDLPGDCKRISRITAEPDGKKIRMEIDIERNGILVVHQVFQLHRVDEAQAREE